MKQILSNFTFSVFKYSDIENIQVKTTKSDSKPDTDLSPVIIEVNPKVWTD